MKELNEQNIAEAYQPLFDLMQQEYSLILLESEMDEIIKTSLKVVEDIDKLYAASRIENY